jgi:hypothetical protein
VGQWAYRLRGDDCTRPGAHLAVSAVSGNDDGGLTPFGQKWEATLIVAAIILIFALPFLLW